MNPDICGVTKCAKAISCNEFRDTIMGTGYTITSQDENESSDSLFVLTKSDMFNCTMDGKVLPLQEQGDKSCVNMLEHKDSGRKLCFANIEMKATEDKDKKMKTI